ncbi:MAG: DUF1015 domain-containing protein [Actinobacteria bacterium]|nr:DUF1015 domain-containing protein [Actinomycetota bacterium]
MSGLAQVTSPPYDVIAADNEPRLMAADPHNVVRLILPMPSAGQPANGYQNAAADLARWLTDGILVPDPEPALYVYEQAATGQGVLQRGLIGALGLVPYAAGIVLPHENVMPGPVAGRRKLMAATKANLEPIFLLYQGGNGLATRLVDSAADSRPPLAQTTTSDGLRHRLWAITDAGELGAIAADLAPRTALIADGHHRYAAYLELQRRLREGGAGPGPWDRGLALLVDSALYPPHVGAIHRVVDGLVPETAARLASAAFTVRELAGGTADVHGALAELERACDSEGRGMSFLLAGRGRAWLLTDPAPALLQAAVPDEPARLWQRVGGAVMVGLLFERLWGVEDDDRSVRAFHDGEAAITAVGDKAGCATAVLCCPMTADQVYQVAALGRKVPRKSTSFGPKPRTGLVMRLFAHG